MDLRIFTEPQQGASYQQQLAVARATQECGFDAFFRSDHYLAMGGVAGLPGPTDAWTTLAGLARETARIRLGTLVTPATFREPGVLAIQVAQVDQMSGGRVELGLGAGWFEAEHAAYGLRFPPAPERFDRLTEQLEVITGLWSTPVGERFSHQGRYWTVSDSPALPKPAQPQVPVILGGHGPRRTPALAARFATEFNFAFGAADDAAAQFGRVRRACDELGRDPAQVTFSAALTLCCGRDDAEVARRAQAIGKSVADLVEHGVAGTPDQVVHTLGRYADAGAERMYLQVLDLDDLDQLELVAARVMPQVR